MTNIHLNRSWKIGERIGAGGFGQVFAATSEDIDAVAKFIPKVPGAERELLFADLSGVRNIVPIIDSGETKDAWVLVMPKASKSLRQYLTESGGSLDPAAAVKVMVDIAETLADLQDRVVHRDLKPENALFLNDKWCLADFGISRYADATTAPETQKFALSPPYAAPERWRNERATSAVDVYALGVMAYEMLSGSLPFVGPTIEAFREQHLHHDPAPLHLASKLLMALIEECLYKSPETRPPSKNVLARLQRLESPLVGAGLEKLQQANLEEIARRAEAARRKSEAQSEAERRDALVGDAKKSLLRMMNALKETILVAASAVEDRSAGVDGWELQLNQATLSFQAPTPTSMNPWGSWPAPSFEVVAHSSILLRKPTKQYGYEGRAHSLWFCDAHEEGIYHWFELAFMFHPMYGRTSSVNPFHLDPGEESAKALGHAISEFQVAWPFTPLTIDALNEFVDRWAGWFADAVQGSFEHPSSMPEHPVNGTWRTE